MNSFHWIDEDSKKAVADWRAENRHIAELKTDLADFREIFWHPQHDGQRAWAEMMIKSIEHELDQLGEEV